ncbi:MAG: O-methyltransferase [Dehalococcoidia bacterium]|nr:O-methyltransferase [Dehalococcoidia bacterium]
MPEPLTPIAIEDYAASVSTADPGLLAELEAETRATFPERISMLTGHPAGRFLATLSAMLRPHLVVEVGTFTGYSALSMAEGLAPGGRVITLDISETHTAVARRYFERSAYSGQIEIRLGAALESLAGIAGPIDLAFIDADKVNYLAYYEAILGKLAPNGLIVADNVLWYGRIFDEADQTADTRAIREFNAKVGNDPRVEAVLLTVRDGMTLIRRR